jgi:hypothetical protein
MHETLIEEGDKTDIAVRKCDDLIRAMPFQSIHSIAEPVSPVSPGTALMGINFLRLEGMCHMTHVSKSCRTFGVFIRLCSPKNLQTLSDTFILASSLRYQNSHRLHPTHPTYSKEKSQDFTFTYRLPGSDFHNIADTSRQS